MPCIRIANISMIMRAAIVAIIATGGALAEDAGSQAIITNFTQAFSGDDSTAKREAVRSVATLGKDMDDDAYKLLVQGVDDRQSHDDAVIALRARTGLAPTINNRGTGYPGYPNSDDASDWNNWLAARTKDKSEQRKLAEQEKKLHEIEEQKKLEEQKKKDAASKKEDAPPGKDAPGKDPGAAADTTPATPKVVAPANDYGKPSRIMFKNGSTLVCYVVSKRLDSDGVLQSIRIVHLEGGGEETLTADLIVRIDENVR